MCPKYHHMNAKTAFTTASSRSAFVRPTFNCQNFQQGNIIGGQYNPQTSYNQLYEFIVNAQKKKDSTLSAKSSEYQFQQK